MSTQRGSRLLRNRTLLIAAGGILVFALGLWIGGLGSGKQAPTQDHGDHAEGAEQAEVSWTCSMHPQIQQPKPGSCPLCGMDLIPAESGGSESGSERSVTLSSYARTLAEVETTPVERRFVTRPVRMIGKVDFDETRVARISAWMPGRIERLYVDYQGIKVRAGDHLLDLYSPELLTAQQELVLATGINLAAAREKLRLLGLSPEQIAEIESRGTPGDQITVQAPISGVVIKKDAVEGSYVKTGSPLYSIADLSHLWVKIEAYERDLPWIHYGQSVTLTTEAYPGESFDGRLVFIDPLVDSKTRTVALRVNVANTDGKLKPGMLVYAVVESEVGADGQVFSPDLAGKWISPMHPEVIKDGPGTCDVCGVPLKRAEDLGYVSEGGAEAPLVIPASAPLITGERAIVYVADPSQEGTYEGREIQLGPRAGDFYVVHEGLEEGEQVVSRGNFKIDCAIQIVAGTSMMSPGEGGAAASEPQPLVAEDREPMAVTEEFRAAMTPVYDAYFALQFALSHDDLPAGKTAAKKLAEVVSTVETDLPDTDAKALWEEDRELLHRRSIELAEAPDVERARVIFEFLSIGVTQAVRSYGSTADAPILRYHCPMAFDWKGADWLQDRAGTENPYFGSMMFKCGSEKEVLWAGSEQAAGEHSHD